VSANRTWYKSPSYPAKANAMTKTGRNDACPCGSGKKYKHCCLKKDETTEHTALTAASQVREERAASQYSEIVKIAARYEDDLALTKESNAVIHLIRAGKLDDAEHAARDLLVRFPDVHDGYDRLGMVYEARGDNKQAANYYHQALDFIRAHPDQYDDPELEAVFQKLIDKLDPPAAI
jgi:tetratricopeptide (TPR) repeat protein